MDLRLSKGVRSIVILSPENRKPLSIFKAKKNSKLKRSRGLRALEKTMRRLSKADRARAETYWQRHMKSTRKKRDGWLRDLGYNLYRASRRQAKVLNFPVP